MKKPVLLIESPNRPNIGYTVKVVPPDPSKTFQTVVKDLSLQKGNYKRTIVYCQSIKVATQLYGFFQAELGKDIYADETMDPRKRFVEMFHSRIDELNREQILQSMALSGSSIRVLIATIAYGMGIDCKDVKVVIHYGPSKNLHAREWKGWQNKLWNVQISIAVLQSDVEVLSWWHKSLCKRVLTM